MKFSTNPGPHQEALPSHKRRVTQAQETAPKQLPMDAYKEDFLEAVRNQESTILIGENGSGKTTGTPGYLLDTFPEAKIAFTSPRVLPALTVSEYVAEKRGGKIGGEIGVITRQEKNVSDETRLTFMSDGVLLSMFKNDPLLMDMDIVTIDEAHERSLNIDLCLGLLKDAQKKRKEQGKKELKIIVASATMEEEKFVDYFEGVKALKVPGRMYPVDLSYVPPGVGVDGEKESHELTAARLVKKIVTSREEGDILIFMPGEQEITKTIDEINQLVGSMSSLEVLPLYSSLQKNEQKKVFQNNGKRKIIVATNIAETSVTIPLVRHVIDTGTVKQKNYNPDTGIDELKIIETSQANMNQRMGRAGRTAPGTCYRLMSEGAFKDREEFQKPEIKRANLGETILRMKDMGINDVAHFDFIESPKKESIRDAISQLKKLGALGEDDMITDIGKKMAHLEMRPDLSRMLIEAESLGALKDMVNLCSMISSTKQLMIQGKPEKAKSEEDSRKVNEQMRNQATLRVKGSDFLTLLTIWDRYAQSNYSGAFAYNHLLNNQGLIEVGRTRSQLLKNLAEGGVQVNQTGDRVDIDKVLTSLVAGSPGGLLYSTDAGRSYNPFNDDEVLYGARIFPGSSVFKNGGNLIFALNIERTEKKEKDRFSGVEVLKSNLWAKTCHTLSAQDIEKMIPGSVIEKDDGSIHKNYNGDYIQTQGIYILGKRIGVKSKILKGYFPPVDDRFFSSLSYENTPRREYPFTASAYGVIEVIPEVHENNSIVRLTVEDYQKRAWGGLVLSEEQKENISDIYELYTKKITALGITTKEDVLSHKNDFEIKLEDFISQEEMMRIDVNSPKVLSGDEKTFTVLYKQDVLGVHAGKKRVVIQIKEIGDIDDFLQVKLPSFFGADEVVFSLNHASIQTASYHSRYGTFGDNTSNILSFYTIDELRAYNEKHKKAEAKKLRRKERREEVTPEESLQVEPKEKESMIGAKPLEVKEKITPITLEIEDIRSLLLFLRGVAQGKHIRELKDKEKVLERVKDVLSKVNATIKEMEYQKSSSLDTGIYADLMQSLRIVAKRVGIPITQSEGLPYVYKHNQKALITSAERNEVEVNEELLKKITTKSIEYSLEHNAVFTDEQADEVIIELV